MKSAEALESLLRSYVRYYDVKKEDVLPPFSAVCEFHSCEKGYFLTQRAVISEAESHEYIYFYAAERLSAKEAIELSKQAWQEGLKDVEPNSTHKSTDVSLVYLAEFVEPEAFKMIKKLHGNL